MLWINFLHLYQPANAKDEVIAEATECSYLRIVRALEEHPGLKFTMNISGCLLERWLNMGNNDLIRRLDSLLGSGRIDLTGTAAYHPLLPLMPEAEVRRQIRENEKILAKCFGPEFRPRGFFLPEMAYSPETARIVKDCGYEWLILDEIAAGGRLGADTALVYLDQNSGLKALLRSRLLSSGFVPDILKAKLDSGEGGDDAVFITATDGELYGLRHVDHTAEFEKFIKLPDVRTTTISEYIDLSQGQESAISPSPHSWETSEEDYGLNRPFLLWQDRENPVHSGLWDLCGMAFELLEKYQKDDNYRWARWHLVRGMASCTWWWASGRDFRRIFGPVAWNPDQVELGIEELVRAVRSLDDSRTRTDKLAAEKLALDIRAKLWERHWLIFWK